MVENIAVQRDIGARERIVAAARCLFSSRGFHQTAMADLAKEAKVSVGAIYRSFESKADIVRAIIVADNMLRPGGEDVRRYAEAVRAKPGITSVLLPVGSGIEVSRLELASNS